jgi:hypothetical protein
LSASARLKLAEAALERKRDLAAEKIVPLREVQEAESAAGEARAAVRASRAAIAAFGVEPPADETDDGTSSAFVLRSPVAGSVIERSAVVGQMLDPATPAFRIGNLSTLWLTVHAFERDAVRIRQGVAARLSFPALPGQDFAGTVSVVGRQVESESRTVPVRIDVKNSGNLLRPGMSATATLPVGETGAPILTGPGGVGSTCAQRMVCVPAQGREHFEIRRIGRGRDLGGEVEIPLRSSGRREHRGRWRVSPQGAGREGRRRSRCALRHTMISRVIRESFHAPLLTALLVAAGTTIGAFWIQDLGGTSFPDLSAPVFNVITQNAAMGAEELETAIAIPLEVALAGLPDVRRVRSNSQLGVAQVTIEFEPSADYYRSRQFVAERVGQVAGQLPPGTDSPLISSLTGRLNEIFEFTLEADPGAADLMTLRDLAEFEVNNRLLAVPGVAAVERLGGYLRQFQVQLDPERMSARRVSLDEVMHAVEESNLNASGGIVAQGSIEWTVRAIGRAQTVDDLRRTVVTTKGDVPVLLGDVADIREAAAVRRGVAHRLKGEVVSARIIKQFGSDTVTVAAGIRDAVEDIRRTLPTGVQLRIVYDQSQLVSSALSGVGRAVMLGGVFVVLVILVLLGNVRAALVVTFTIPLSIALAGLLLRPLGVGLNTMTLGGLADRRRPLGRRRNHHGGEHPPPAGGRDVSPGPAGAGTRSRRGGRSPDCLCHAHRHRRLPSVVRHDRHRRPYVSALGSRRHSGDGRGADLGGYAGAHRGSRVLRPTKAGADDVLLLRKIKQWYAPALDRCLRHPVLVGLVTLLVAVPSAALGLRIGSDFMPQLDEGAFLLQTVLPPEASLDEVDRLNHRVEDVLRQYPKSRTSCAGRVVRNALRIRCHTRSRMCWSF